MIIYFTNHIFEFRADLVKGAIKNLHTGGETPGHCARLHFYVIIALLRLRCYTKRFVTWPQVRRMAGKDFTVINFQRNYGSFRETYLAPIDLTDCLHMRNKRVRLAPNIEVQCVKSGFRKEMVR